ncbi:MAG: hypothetical protein V5A57_03320 [Candidatus Paceibacterota bacterium]
MSKNTFDVRNTIKQHLIVGVFSLGLVVFLNKISGVDWSTAFGRVSFLLIFLTLIIGPIMRLKKPGRASTPLKTPWSWRGELGIWFTITALLHFFFAMSGFINWNFMKSLGGGIGGGGLGLANLLGYVALFWSLLLALTSFNKVIKFLGVDSWKWLQSHAYVIFYLVAGHLLYFQFFSTYGEGPDLFGYAAVVMIVTVVVLQMAGFLKAVNEHRKS